jgi:hypothetical protein
VKIDGGIADMCCTGYRQSSVETYEVDLHGVSEHRAESPDCKRVSS